MGEGTENTLSHVKDNKEMGSRSQMPRKVSKNVFSLIPTMSSI